MGGGASKSRPSSAHPDGPKSAAGKRSTQLGQVLFKSGVTKVIMIRHANAQPRDPEASSQDNDARTVKPNTPFANAWTVGDLERDITEKGKEQAAAATEWLKKYGVRAVICSEAKRATATCAIMTEGKFPPLGAGYLTLHTLHPARSGTPDCEKMFDTLGYGTLNTYFSNSSVEGLEGKGKIVFRHYMDKVTGELDELISAGKANFPTTGDTIVVFGHAVFLNAVAVAIGEAMGIPDAEGKVAVLELGETQGILCDSSAQEIKLLAA